MAEDCATRKNFAPGVHSALFVGNSDAEALSEVYNSLVNADSCTPGPAKIGHWTRFSWSLADQWANAQTEGHLKRLLEPGKHGWQHVLLQDQSQIPMFHAIDSSDYKESTHAAINLAKLIDEAGATTSVVAMPAYREGDPDNGFPTFPIMQMPSIGGTR